MAFEVSGWRKLTQFVSYHELRYVHGDELVAIMHRQRMPHEIRSDRAPAAPGFDHPFLRRPIIDRQDLLLEVRVYVRTFFY